MSVILTFGQVGQKWLVIPGFLPGASLLSIPALPEPPVRILRATLPATQSHTSSTGNYHSGNQETTIPVQGNHDSGPVETIT